MIANTQAKGTATEKATSKPQSIGSPSHIMQM